MRLREFMLCVAVAAIMTASGFGQEIVRCESNDMRRHYCDVGANREIRFARQVSDAKCIPDQTFGVQGNRIWVDRGCRGEFQVFRGGNRPGDRDRDYNLGGNRPGDRDRGYNRDRDHGNRGGNVVNIKCESNDEHRRTCPVNGEIRNVRMLRQISGSQCRQGRSWGFRGNELWVDRGCRADFEVTLR